MAVGDLSDDQRGRQSRHSDDDYRRYWSLSERERQEFVRSSYAQRDPKDPYATSRDYNARELEIQSIVENVLPGTVLDLGCGNGFTLLRVAQQVSGRFTGVDFSEHLIGGARELAEAAPISNKPNFICADAVEYLRNQSTGSVDCMISERFIQNLPSVEWQQGVLTDIFRVLRPGGRALICEGSEVGFERLNDLREKLGLSRIPATSADNISAIRLNDSSFEQYCEQLGFILSRKCGYSLFFLITRVLHPLLVAPQAPRFDAEINNLARAIQSHSPFEPGFGGNELWILEKPVSNKKAGLSSGQG
jgi:SAM-dependent methyltransferase